MRLKSLLKSRCPHCLEGEIFLSFMTMNETCPVCGIKFERENGYFMMAVFMGYVMGTAVALPLILILYLSGASLAGYLITLIPALIVLSPVIFHYARVVWLHIDEILDPRREQESSKSL